MNCVIHHIKKVYLSKRTRTVTAKLVMYDGETTKCSLESMKKQPIPNNLLIDYLIKVFEKCNPEISPPKEIVV